MPNNNKSKTQLIVKSKNIILSQMMTFLEVMMFSEADAYLILSPADGIPCGYASQMIMMNR